jgi:hypothetical protein
LPKARAAASPVIGKIVNSAGDIHREIVAGMDTYLPVKLKDPERFLL